MNEKILVRGVNWIGDAVMTLPALEALRKAFPGSRISLLVRPSVAQVFERNPNVDEVIRYEEKGVLGKLRLARKLRKAAFSKAILLQNALDAALISFLAGIPERIGYDRDARGFLLTKRIAYDNDDRRLHHIDYYLNLLASAGISVDCYRPDPWIYLSLEERLEARDALSLLRRPLLGINPGAAYGPAKRWPPDRFAEVARWFIRDIGGSVVIFGGEDEKVISQEIEFFATREGGALPSHASTGRGGQAEGCLSVLNLAGKTSLRNLIALISECDVFVGNDSGPMHIAYAVGTPLVAIFGSTSPELTGPAGKGSAVIKPEVSCSPCFGRTCRNNDMRCMYELTSDNVYLEVKRILPDSPAAFFDRDGTLCEDVNYLSKWSDFRLLPGNESLVRLKARGFKLFGVTNQSGIARGFVDEGFVREVNQFFIKRFGFDDFLYCPHHPDEHCSCRKPEPGMLVNARSVYKTNLRRSFVVGDKDDDMVLARSVGAKGILVRTGRQKESFHADFIVGGLREAVDLILRIGVE